MAGLTKPNFLFSVVGQLLVNSRFTPKKDEKERQEMSVSPREKLRCALITMAKNEQAEDMVDSAMAVLEPLFQIAEAGLFGGNGKPITPESVTETFATVLKVDDLPPTLLIRPNSPTIKLSLNQPDWCPRGFHELLDERVQKALQEAFHYLLKGDYNGLEKLFQFPDGKGGYSFDSRVDEQRFHQEREEHIANTLGKPLREALESSLSEGLLKDLSHRAWWACAFIIDSYLRQLTYGQEADVARLEPLVKLLPSCVPFACASGDKGFFGCVDFGPKRVRDPLYPTGWKPG